MDKREQRKRVKTVRDWKGAKVSPHCLSAALGKDSHAQVTLVCTYVTVLDQHRGVQGQHLGNSRSCSRQSLRTHSAERIQTAKP